jgi:hypothetical protein
LTELLDWNLILLLILMAGGLKIQWLSKNILGRRLIRRQRQENAIFANFTPVYALSPLLPLLPGNPAHRSKP